MSDKIIKEENLDEIIKNVVKDIKKGEVSSSQEIDKLMAEANENVDFVKVLNDIKLAAPNNRVIYIDGNEQMLYDDGEFFMCETTDSTKPKKKIKRKEATEKYIEYFIRYQLNPIIDQKNMYNISKTIAQTEITKEVEVKVENKIENKVKKAEKPETVKVKSVPKKVAKIKDDLSR
jgi:alkylated DNA nucleotide flippase Atl1